MKEVLTGIKAISEEIRIRTIMLLINREACVCELMEVFGMPQSKLSHHLIALKKAGILLDDRRGKWNYYRLSPLRLSPCNRLLVGMLEKVLANDPVVVEDKKKMVKACCR
jgi:ArsR family transcriptional regulator, arsenate/arsenite/antimonite-responsive transcriptional repressor